MTNLPPQTANTTPSGGWANFYQNLQSQGKVPSASLADIKPDHSEFRDNVLDLVQVQHQIQSAGVTPTITTLYTDILQVTADVTWQLNDNALVIYARQIILANNVTLKFELNTSKHNGPASLTIFGQDLNGSIGINNSTLASSDISPGVSVTCASDNTLTKTPLELADGFPIKITDVQQDYLSNSYIYAVLSYMQSPYTAVNMLTWIENWALASNSDELYQLYFRASSLRSLLNAQLIAQQSGAIMCHI